MSGGEGSRAGGGGSAPGGCLWALIAAGILVGAATFLLVFLDSGANSGQLALRPAASYSEGTVEFLGERNLYIVRLSGGDFLALADLDAANRNAAGRRCRVAPLAATDPRLPDMLDRYRREMSRDAMGSTLIFREECHGAVYDMTGRRLDSPGPNLDRYRTSIDEEGRLVVDVSRRICTEPRDGETFAESRCGAVAGKGGLP